MAKKSIVTSAKMAKLASKVLKGYEPTASEINSLAACVLRQREKEEDAKGSVILTAATNDKITAVIHPSAVAELGEQGIDAVAEVQAALDLAASPEKTTTENSAEASAEAFAEQAGGFWSNIFKQKTK
jgi:hypothetical protein